MTSRVTPKKFVILIALGYFALIGFDVVYEHGEVWCTKKNGYGCVCHGPQASPEVYVRVEGPTRISLGDSAFYRIYVSGGPAVAAGFNVAAGHGNLSPADTSSYIIDGELTHVLPIEFGNDTVVSWQFIFRGTQLGPDTIFSVANSANGNSAPTDDKWNFGENLVVMVQEPVAVTEQQESARTFSLIQNFPNPFNSSTMIHYQLPAGQGNMLSYYVTLKVYDVLGQEVTTLVDDIQSPGYMSVKWETDKLPSGVYFYKLIVVASTGTTFIDVQKAIVMK